MQYEPIQKYPSEPLKCWNKAKELRDKYYHDYATAHERGGIRWSGGAAGIESVMAGFGKDVYPLTGEPYGASIAFDKAFATKCHAAAEEAGYPRDLCAYMRNYWGSKLLNTFAFGGPFPEPDLYWQFHSCCSHGKWYQEAARIEGKGKPVFVTDCAVGSYFKFDEKTGNYFACPNENGIRYVVNQLHEHIEKIEKLLKRPFQDELLFEAAERQFDVMTTWPKIFMLNQNIPAPLDQKSMFSLYVLAALNKSSKDFMKFYHELHDEVQDRVKRGIAAVPTERARVMDDIQPPWGFLRIFRHLESYGCACVGSYYSASLMFAWDITPDGKLVPKLTPKERGIQIKSRDDCLYHLADFLLTNLWFNNMQDNGLKGWAMKQMVDQWHVDGIMIHFNRGCEGLSMGVAEQRMYLAEHGIPVMSFEGNMGDEREFDETETKKRIDTFMETLGLK